MVPALENLATHKVKAQEQKERARGGEIPRAFFAFDLFGLSYLNTFLTRPISPLSNRTLIPWGCIGDFVKMSFTTPSVSFPEGWFCFNTIKTLNPGFISPRFVPFMIPPSLMVS